VLLRSPGLLPCLLPALPLSLRMPTAGCHPPLPAALFSHPTPFPTPIHLMNL
jgi:hypothetical protein